MLPALNDVKVTEVSALIKIAPMAAVSTTSTSV
jgi:hypothetical protein